MKKLIEFRPETNIGDFNLIYSQILEEKINEILLSVPDNNQLEKNLSENSYTIIPELYYFDVDEYMFSGEKTHKATLELFGHSFRLKFYDNVLIC